ncbi:hypothetical protein BFR47_10515 [Oceanisphaera psychrotolerans]|uniref:Uncharacterized protein n=1 Tax=Oceanisphaera psychrotolerans TaxID=1414654 RepID=A0A1J4QI48_9GAMM|nr:hypothetical protein BFR47_10515 [Oceanisphaera psychrotolerans]
MSFICLFFAHIDGALDFGDQIPLLIKDIESEMREIFITALRRHEYVIQPLSTQMNISIDPNSAGFEKGNAAGPVPHMVVRPQSRHQQYRKDRIGHRKQATAILATVGIFIPPTQCQPYPAVTVITAELFDADTGAPKGRPAVKECFQ